MLMGEVDQFVDFRLQVVDLARQKLFPRLFRSNTRSQYFHSHPSNFLQARDLGFSHVEPDGGEVLDEKGRDLIQCIVGFAEDVDVVQVGEDDMIRSECYRKAIEDGANGKGKEEGAERVSLSNALSRFDDRSV